MKKETTELGSLLKPVAVVQHVSKGKKLTNLKIII